MRHSLRQLTQYLKDQRPDVVLASYEEVVALCVIARFISGTPGEVIWWQHIHFTSQLRSESKGFLEVAGKYLLYLVISRFVRRFIAVSQGVRANFARALFLPPERVSHLRNPVKPQSIRSEYPAAHGGGKPKFIFVGRLCAQKQVNHILEAVRRLPEDISIQLDIMGDGAERARLSEIARSLPQRHVVIFHGASDRPWERLDGDRVLLMSSLFEGNPVVIHEALALGFPTISYDTPTGPGEIILNGVSGIVVAFQDIDALARAIESVWRDQDLYGRLRRGALDAARDYNFDEAVRAFETFILSEVTGESSRPANS
jgi:glycosyltransferase involved in cell wall biosynthesis